MTGTPVVAVFAQKNFELQTGRWSPWAAPYRLVKLENDWPSSAVSALTELLGTAATHKA
jgi:hypothetical protein